MAFVGKRSNNEKFKKIKTFYIKKRRKPLELVFDEKDREDFLTGFRKRKLQRKKKAQEELAREVKAERKKIRQEAKDALKKLISRPDDPDFGEIYADPEVVDMGSHEVQVTELDPVRLAKENNWIGSNLGCSIKEIKEEEIKEEEIEETDPNEIEGMETSTKKKVAKPKWVVEDLNLKSTKDIKKYVKSVATKKMQTSKVFQKKKVVEKIKNKVKKAREERKQEKDAKKTKRKRKKLENKRRNMHNNND